jgi:hypothetical protein
MSPYRYQPFFSVCLGIGKLYILIKKNLILAVNFFKFLVIKTLDPNWILILIGIQPKMLDPDSYKIEYRFETLPETSKLCLYRYRVLTDSGILLTYCLGATVFLLCGRGRE